MVMYETLNNSNPVNQERLLGGLDTYKISPFLSKYYNTIIIYHYDISMTSSQQYDITVTSSQYQAALTYCYKLPSSYETLSMVLTQSCPRPCPCCSISELEATSLVQ